MVLLLNKFFYVIAFTLISKVAYSKPTDSTSQVLLQQKNQAPLHEQSYQAEPNCKTLMKIQSLPKIHDQFQLIQLGRSNSLTELQEKELEKIFNLNNGVTNQLDCYAELAEREETLSSFLTILKLQILEIRVAAIKGQKEKLEKGFTQLRETQNKLVMGQSTMKRRLAATVRSLLLDELENESAHYTSYSALVKDQLQKLHFIGRPGESVQANILAKIKSQSDTYSRFADKQKLATELASDLSNVKWQVPAPSKSALAKILGHLKSHPMSLQEQLFELFNEYHLKNAEKGSLFDITNSENVLRHYSQAVVTEMQKSPYLSIKDWLEPVVQTRVKDLKQELGFAWPLFESLGGVTLEGKMSSIKKPIEILDPARFKKAKEAFVKIKNPIGRLFEVVILREAQQEWTEIDVAQLKTDLNRSALLTTSLAINDYKVSNNRAPASIEDLVKNKILVSAPKDYFTGESFQYSAQTGKVWSVGENRRNEQGEGDDISVSVKNF